ncbi:hypothetical protein LEP1GSC061_2090 [Leptospira wolffii serovar Khorat str. Khorat-H2]|nr:hypothetical protein LEP1GSC061_2090 [Leptospira wolffii serovar Khorat str. Khorat-H2]
MQPLLGLRHILRLSLALQSKSRAIAKRRQANVVSRHYAKNIYMNTKYNNALDFAIRQAIGRKLSSVDYVDIKGGGIITCSVENMPVINIVGCEVCLHFENISLFVSWNSSEETVQYVIGVSNIPFFNRTEHLDYFIETENPIWQTVTNKKLIKATVYGYRSFTMYDPPETTPHIDQPFALLFEFDGESRIGFCNAYAQPDFVPRTEYGDDVWILKGELLITKVIQPLEMEKLFSVMHNSD